ncbi:MAG: DUF350 domain-containing protein [Candidatus Micrarchaeia archaeon]
MVYSFLELGLFLFQFILSLVIAVFSIYAGLRILNFFTKDLDEFKELKKGNIAVGILVFSVVISVAIIIEPILSDSFLSSLKVFAGTSFTIFVLQFIGKIILGIFAAMIAIYFSMTVFDQLTPSLNEIKELKKGNISLALLFSGVILAVSFIVKNAINYIIGSLWVF